MARAAACAAVTALVATGMAAATAGAGELPGQIAVEASYTGHLFHIPRGGLGTGTRYLDSLSLTLAVENAFSRPGLTLFAQGLYNNGEVLSGELVGDTQGVSNIETVRAARLFQAWVEYRSSAAHSLRFGLYDINSEFDAGAAEALFLNGSHGMGPDASQSGANGVSTFPVTGLALRYRRETDRWYAQAAVFEGIPGDPGNQRSNAVSLDAGEGVLAVVEAGISAGALHRLAVGHWRYSAAFADLVQRDRSGLPRRHDGNRGSYAMLETGLGRDAAEHDGRWRAFLRYGIAQDDFNPFRSYLGAGLVRRGASPRGNGSIGLALARVQTGAPYRRALRAAGTTADRHETNLELTWQIPFSRWLTVQPDLQYVMNPGTDRNHRDAIAVGIQFQLLWQEVPGRRFAVFR